MMLRRFGYLLETGVFVQGLFQVTIQSLEFKIVQKKINSKTKMNNRKLV